MNDTDAESRSSELIYRASTDPRILTTKDVAELLQATEPVVLRGVRANRIPASRIGGEWRYWKPLVITRNLGGTPPPPTMWVPLAPNPADTVNLDELSALLLLTRDTLKRRIRDGSLAAAKTGKRWVLHWPTIRDTLAQGRDFTPRR